MMRKYNQNLAAPDNSNLFDRVVSILERARTDSVRAVNNNMVIAYWMIGREIVLEIQGGKERAEYGKQLIEQLSKQLTQKYGRGFSTTNLRYFRTFYTVYADRDPGIRHIAGGELTHQDVGQMDSYVRMYDDKYLTEGDNPTIGLILCAKKNETIAKYSVLKDSRQIFASKYMLYLPTEEELQRELQRERLLIEKQSNKVPKPK